ncbi:hypothetical protein R1flu_017700 [Riccia fluitans]|uniref:Transposase n=1 Tax=Riccia fluitans TaxID=41844 RepID=A0ABD1ZDX2_9MARC
MAMWSEELRRLTLFDGEADSHRNHDRRRGIAAKVFFSIVSTCRYVTVAERTQHLELRGLTGRKLVLSPEVVRSLGIPGTQPTMRSKGPHGPIRRPGRGSCDGQLGSALMKIIKHNRALSTGPTDCPEPWEVYTDCSGSYEQADVLRGVHSRRAMAKDALPRRSCG